MSNEKTLVNQSLFSFLVILIASLLTITPLRNFIM